MHMAKNKCFFTRLLSVFFMAALASWPAQALPEKPPEFIKTYINTPKLVGQGQYHRLFWKIYDAALFAHQGKHKQDENYALLLEYSRDLSGDAIVEKSIELMAAQGVDDSEKLERWEGFLGQVIPDVRRGDQITGIRTENAAYFYFNNELLGQTSDPEFKKYFFAIWLGKNTTAPDLRQALTGQLPSGSQE